MDSAALNRPALPMSVCLSVVCALLSWGVVCVLLARFLVFPDQSAVISSTYILPVATFSPEPLERWQYVSGVVTIPLFLLGWFTFWYRRVFSKLSEEQITPLFPMITYALGVGLIILGVLDFYCSPRYARMINLTASTWGIPFLLITSIAGAILFLQSSHSRLRSLFSGIFAGLAVLVTLLIPGIAVFNESVITDLEAFTFHFNSVFHAVSQVFLGKALLIDLTHIYGLYPQLLNPIFQVTGLSVLKFSVTMTVLILIGFLSLFLFLRSALRHRYIVYCAYAAIVGVGYLISKPANYNEVYFQYMPIRFLFPAVSVYLSWWYFKTRHQAVYVASFFLYALALVWNLDTGLVVMASWVLTLIYLDLAEKTLKPALVRMGLHLGWALIAIISMFGSYSIIVKLVYGQFPDFSLMGVYQTLFYKLGYLMLPIPGIFDPWNLVVVMYVLGLGLCILPIFMRRVTPRYLALCFVSLLGIGLFSYYQGRSQVVNLLSVAYPALLILAMVADASVSRMSGSPPAQRHLNQFVSVSILAVLIYIDLTILIVYPDTVRFVWDKFSKMAQNQSTVVSEHAAFLKSQLKPHEKVVILSDYTGIYYLAAQADNPLALPGFFELYRRTDYAKAEAFFKANPHCTIVLDNTFRMIPTSYANHLIDILKHQKRRVVYSPDATLLILR